MLDKIIHETLAEMIRQIEKPYAHMQRVDMRLLEASSITVFDYFYEQRRLFKILLSSHLQVDIRHQIATAIEKLFIQQYEYALASTEVDVKWLYIYRAHGLADMMIKWIEEDFSTPSHIMAEQVLQLMTLVTYEFHVK